MREFLQVAGSMLPLISIVAAATAIILLGFMWGHRDAQKAAVATWRELAEGYKETIDDQSAKLEACEGKVKASEAEVAATKVIMRDSIDELIAGFQRALEKGAA